MHGNTRICGRLKDLFFLLKRNRTFGITTWQVGMAIHSTRPSSDISELRALLQKYKWDVKCRYAGSQNHKKLHRYFMFKHLGGAPLSKLAADVVHGKA